MAFPYLLENGFETGAIGFDTAITDTESKSLGYLHYVDSVKKYGVAPYRGAYMWGLDQDVGTATTACNQTQAAFNVSDTHAYAVSAAIYLKGHVMTNGDRTSLITVRSAAADQAVIQLYYTTAGGLQLLCTQAAATAVGTNPVCSINQNEWFVVEIRGSVQTGGTGTIDFFVNGFQVGAQITTLTNAAITDLYVGATNGDAGHTAGLIFYDEIIADSDAGTAAVPIGLYTPRYPDSVMFGVTRHLFVGPGTVKAASLMTATANDKLMLFDTDAASSTAELNAKVECLVGVNMGIGGPIPFYRGCYAVLSGTNPKAQVFLETVPELAGNPALTAYSEAGVKNYAFKRKPRPGNI